MRQISYPEKVQSYYIYISSSQIRSFHKILKFSNILNFRVAPSLRVIQGALVIRWDFRLGP